MFKSMYTNRNTNAWVLTSTQNLTCRGLAIASLRSDGSVSPPVGTRNPRVLGSSEPTPEEPLRRGGAQGGSGSDPPPWWGAMRRTLLHPSGADASVSGAVSSCSPTTSLHREGRDEAPPRRGEHSAARCWLVFHSSAIKDVGHEALWLACGTRFASLERTRRIFSVTDCDTYTERKLSSSSTQCTFALRMQSGSLFIELSRTEK